MKHVDDVVVIAETGAFFADFSPYVASIDDKGRVAFQATLQSGRTAVFVGDEKDFTCVTKEDSLVQEVYSHPDIDPIGRLSFYGRGQDGIEGVFWGDLERWEALVQIGPGFQKIGPLGPTMDSLGRVAFRATLSTAQEGIFVSDPLGAWRCIAQTEQASGESHTFSCFFGLPVVFEGGVIFRADRKDGVQGIYLDDGDKRRTLVETGDDFSWLGLFPCVNRVGDVVFAASKPNGDAGIFVVSSGKIEQRCGGTEWWESFRGALINDRGTIVFFAVPKGRNLGVFVKGLERDVELFSVGDLFQGSPIVDFALNPVSFNNIDQIALRIRLENQKQFILRSTCPYA